MNIKCVLTLLHTRTGGGGGHLAGGEDHSALHLEDEVREALRLDDANLGEPVLIQPHLLHLAHLRLYRLSHRLGKETVVGGHLGVDAVGGRRGREAWREARRGNVGWREARKGKGR